jgi:hypothetical protein
MDFVKDVIFFMAMISSVQLLRKTKDVKTTAKKDSLRIVKIVIKSVNQKSNTSLMFVISTKKSRTLGKKSIG